MIPRSYLFVPGNRAERFDKALASAADVVVLDLEDAVVPDDKALARAAVARCLAAADAALRPRLVVRINDQSTPWFGDDLALLWPRPTRTARCCPRPKRLTRWPGCAPPAPASRCWR